LALERRAAQVKEVKGASRSSFPFSQSSSRSSASQASAKEVDPLMQEILAQKHKYLGIPSSNGPEKKRRKVNEKKFVFDWAGDEDTAAHDMNPIYQNRVIGGVLARAKFGGLESIEKSSKG
jgi:hypothetical protein